MINEIICECPALTERQYRVNERIRRSIIDGLCTPVKGDTMAYISTLHQAACYLETLYRLEASPLLPSRGDAHFLI